MIEIKMYKISTEARKKNKIETGKFVGTFIYFKLYPQ